jgi:hypothetical protein
MEILVYSQFKDTGELAKLFSWSWSGKFLIMERLAPLDPGDLSSHRIPSYLTDRKPENYGKDASGKSRPSTMLRWPSPTRAAISFRLRVVQPNNSSSRTRFAGRLNSGV